MIKESGLRPHITRSSIVQRDGYALKCQRYVELHEIRSAANGGFALGNDKFKAEIAAMLGRRVERPRERNSKFSS